MTYGITFVGLKQSTYYWDMIVVLKFFIVMFTLSLVNTTIVELRQMCVISVLIGFEVFLMKMKPYVDPRLHWADMTAQFIQVLTVFVGVGFYTRVHYPDQDTDIEYLLACVLIIPNLVFYFWFLKQMRHEFLIYFGEDNPTWFKIFSCGLVNAHNYMEAHRIAVVKNSRA